MRDSYRKMSESSEYLTWRRLWNETAEKRGDRVEARWLCEHASGTQGVEFDEILDEHPTTRCLAHLDAMLTRLETGEPLQYVMGRWAFRHLDVMVDSRVLIPRPETELLVDIVVDHCRERRVAQQKLLIADLGTGSGVIGLSVLAEMPPDSCEVWMTDISDDAINVARANAAGIGRSATWARFAVGSWCDALPIELRGNVDVIVSNPPYIADNDPAVDDSVRQWEPRSALFAGPDGLDDVRVIAAQAAQWLTPGGMLAIEIGYQQGDQVRDIFESAGLSGIAVHRDLAGHDRFVSGIRSR
ncbi:MAG: protein methyltransferase HemK [Actinomycetota bacterium]